MTGITRSPAARYARALDALKPIGLAWPRDPDSTQSRVIGALSHALGRLDARIFEVAETSWPGSTGEFLEDWERAVGLPDPCAEPPDPAARAERRDLVIAKLVARGGSSPKFFESLALALGWNIVVERCDVPICGFAECGISTLYPHRIGAGFAGAAPDETNAAYPFWWIVRIQTPVGGTVSECGIAECGVSSLGQFDIDRLQCAFDAVKPAHTRIVWIIEETV
ncbi:MAG: putative phage tail protein [Pseudomonadota bacterium]